MDVLKRCYFCGARAPRIKRSKGIYKVECACGMKIEYDNYDSVIDMWNYEVK